MGCPNTVLIRKFEHTFNVCKIKDGIRIFLLQQILSVPGNCKALGIRYEYVHPCPMDEQTEQSDIYIQQAGC